MCEVDLIQINQMTVKLFHCGLFARMFCEVDSFSLLNSIFLLFFLNT